MTYDVIIVGAGPAAIYAAYELSLLKPQLNIVILEKGRSLEKRHCPMRDGKINKCPPASDGKEHPGCIPACSITAGWGGAGAYSDGKFNLTTQFGGWLQEYMAPSKLMRLIEYVDRINLDHGATTSTTNPDTPQVASIERRAASAGLKLLKARIRHLGTEENLKILQNLYDTLKQRVEIRFQTPVQDILIEKRTQGSRIRGVLLENGQELWADRVILAPGRDGAEWLSDVLKSHGLTMISNQVDIGARIETTNLIMHEINEHLYEAKFIFNSSVGTRVRTFCSNPSGHVVIENHGGVMTANGHAFHDPNLGSQNTNFALLVSHVFTEPFDKPIEYAKEISRRANDLSNGSVIVQKYGDIMRSRRSTVKRIQEGFVEPTLKEAVPGDLGLVLPYNTMKAILEMIQALDHVTPGLASEHTLLYGVEAKLYSARPRLTPNFETAISGLFAIGDGAGITRSLAQASASGVHVARYICATEL